MAWKAGLVALTALLASGTAFAQTPAPDPLRSSTIQRRALAAALEAGDKPALTRAAITLAVMGATLSDASFDRIAPSLDPAILADPKAWGWDKAPEGGAAALQGMFRGNGHIASGDIAPEAASVPAEYRLVEGIAWDAAKKRLFVGTVIDGRLAYLEDGKWTEVPIGSPRGGLFGMAVDSKRRLLWIATGSVEQTAVAGERLTGLIAVDLDTLAVARRAPAEGAGALGDVVVAPDGTVYASNSVTGAIHRCRPGCTALETLLPAGSFRSPQGLALAKDGKRLYLADYSAGLFRIDIAAARAEPLAMARPAMLEGIDGLVDANAFNFPGKQALVAIQNGTRPRRILKIHLDAKDAIVDLDSLQRVDPDGPEPTLGTQVDSALWFVADSQWERYGPGGMLKDGEPLRPTVIRRLDIDDMLITSR